MKTAFSNKRISAFILFIVVLAGWFIWSRLDSTSTAEGFVKGNGRIEATAVDVATKLGGRLESLLVKEGDFVIAGQKLAVMQSDSLLAQRDQALAQLAQTKAAVASAKAQVAMRESDLAALQASQIQRETELDSAQRHYRRSVQLAKEGSLSDQVLDDDRAAVRTAEATLSAAKAQVAAGRAAIEAAKAQVIGAESNVNAAAASVARIETDLADSILTAPRDGRVQYLVTQPGEVLGAGGKVINMIDLSDVYMTFFLPETVAGRIALGQDVHLVLDVAPDYVIPAQVSFVASTAQFTPKTVETASERQKLMFRVRARISPQLLQKYITQVKTGLPGVAWLKLDEASAWPAGLTVNLSAE
jgi:HlyD family secretion protein